MIKCALQTNMIQIKHNRLRIPTGGRLTSWLFTRLGGVEFGATENKSIQWQGGGFEPGTSGLRVQRPTTRPRSLKDMNFMFSWQEQYSHSFAALTREILFLPLEHKILILSPLCNILY